MQSFMHLRLDAQFLIFFAPLYCTVRPIFKKQKKKTKKKKKKENKERLKVKNHRLGSFMNCFAKIFEKYILKKFKPVKNDILSQSASAYKGNYSSCHVWLRLIKNFDKSFATDPMLIDLSKAFDCTQHDLLENYMHMVTV